MSSGPSASNSTAASTQTSSPIPIILLKTRSSPSDNYEIALSSPPLSPSSLTFTPTFIPVLSHTTNLTPLLHHLSTQTPFFSTYGGLIFTSQRAVEALDLALQILQKQSPTQESQTPSHAGELLNTIYLTPGPYSSYLPPFYTVGPATGAALQKVADTNFATEIRRTELAGAAYPVRGKGTGNGGKLAEFILEDYDPPRGITTEGSGDVEARAPLLFFVGETRRDIIPKTLMDPSLPAERRVRIDEVVVYETAVEEGFEGEFTAELTRRRERSESEREREGNGKKERESAVWIVVFSPTGCEAMLRVLGWEKDEGGWSESARFRDGRRRYFVATIGPTTRDYLWDQWGFESDVCARRPSPEGIKEGIEEFMKRLEKE